MILSSISPPLDSSFRIPSTTVKLQHPSKHLLHPQIKSSQQIGFIRKPKGVISSTNNVALRLFTTISKRAVLQNSVVPFAASIAILLWSNPDKAHLISNYNYPNTAVLRAALRVKERSWAKLLDFEPTYTYSGRRKARVTDFLLEDPPEPDPTLPEIILVRLTPEEEMAKRNRLRAMLTETTPTEVPQAGQSTQAVVALPSQQPSASRRNKRARTIPTGPQLVDEDENAPPPNPPAMAQPDSQPESSNRSETPQWAPPLVFNDRAINEDDSVVTEKDHLLAVSLARSVCLPKDMEHHSKKLNTEIKSLRSASKSMIMALQKTTLAHRQVMELRKTARQAMKDAVAKSTELTQAQDKAAVLAAEVDRLTGLVTSAESDKQKAVTEVKDYYLWEMAQMQTKQDAEIANLNAEIKKARKEGFKKAEDAYGLQCGAAKDLFFKCGWRSAVEKLGCTPDTDAYNAPPYFIPASLKQYADDLQKAFLEASGDEEDDEDDDDDEDDEGEPTLTPVATDQQNTQAARLEPTVDLTNEIPTDTTVQTGLPPQTGLQAAAEAELDAELDALLG